MCGYRQRSPDPIMGVLVFLPFAITAFASLLILLGVGAYHRHMRRPQVFRCTAEQCPFLVQEMKERFGIDLAVRPPNEEA